MHITFHNRTDAGQLLAERFLDLRDQPNTFVLALPRGGVPVAAEVARAINAPLDVLLVRKIGVPGREELAMGAIASGNQIVLDHHLIRDFGIPKHAVRQTIVRETEVLRQRDRLYRGDLPFPDLGDKTVVLIDDGLATGSTMRVAIQAVKQQQPAQIIVGVPVGAPDTVEMIAREVDRIECVSSPSGFRAVGQWFRDFRSTSDEDVIAALGNV